MPGPSPATPSRRDILRWAGFGTLAAFVPGLPASAAGPQAQAAAASFDPIRPPAVPLAVRSPYLSTWLAGDTLPGTWPTFWAGAVTAITGIVRVDGSSYVFMGAPGRGIPLASQTSLVITPTRSVFTIDAGPLTLTVTFFSPVDPENLRRQCVPLSYITVTALSRDGASHQASLYLDISGEWAHGDHAQQVTWSQRVTNGQTVLTFDLATPSVLQERSEQASWGTVVFASDTVPGLTWQAAADSVARNNAVTNGALPNTSDGNQPRAIDNNWPVLGFSRDLGSVGATATAPAVFTIGHVRAPAVSYLGTQLRPWWRTYWSDWAAMLGWFRADLPAALAICKATDDQLMATAREQAGGGAAGDRYAALCALALRQAFAATELVDSGGSPWATLKEISSNGDFSTVDVMYPAFPAFLYLSPQYLELVLAPIFDYTEKRGYPKLFAPHDIGVYPNAFGRINADEEDMPIEESANMLIMVAALLERSAPEHATAYATAHYRMLQQWADYLVANLPDPGNQNQTDDFTGFIAHSVNLALKGIVGIGAMAQVATFAGKSADRDRYAAKAREYIAFWSSHGANGPGDHMKLTYDGADSTWSLKYNGFPDRLLGTNLVPPAITAKEASWYLQNQRTYGVLLDPRNDYTKLDWELWTAAFLAAFPATRDALVSKAYDFANHTPQRVPLTDWYVAESGNQRGFAARPVVGGALALLSLRNAPNGLNGLWTFDGGEPSDSSGSGRPLTVHSAPTIPARGGRALSLDGRTGYANAAGPAVRTDASYTVMAWARLDAGAQSATVLSQDGTRTSGFALKYSASENRWAFVVPTADTDGAALDRSLSSAAPAIGTWTHLAGVHDAESGRITLYVDGVAQPAKTHPGPWAAPGAFLAGRGQRLAAPTEYFVGALTDLRAFRGALTTADIAAAAHLSDARLAVWAFSENAGTTAADAGGGNPLALSGGAGWAPGVGGSALSLSGQAQAVLGGPLVDTSRSFSVSAWVQLDSATGWATAVSQDGSRASGFYLQFSAQDNAWAFSMAASDTDGPAPIRAVSPFPPKVGGWTHLTGVYDSAAGQLRLYVDGRRAAEAARTGAWNATGPFAVGRGRWNGAGVDFWPGRIDQVQVWSRALTDTDVRVLI